MKRIELKEENAAEFSRLIWGSPSFEQIDLIKQRILIILNRFESEELLESITRVVNTDPKFLSSGYLDHIIKISDETALNDFTRKVNIIAENIEKEQSQRFALDQESISLLETFRNNLEGTLSIDSLQTSLARLMSDPSTLPNEIALKIRMAQTYLIKISRNLDEMGVAPNLTILKDEEPSFLSLLLNPFEIPIEKVFNGIRIADGTDMNYGHFIMHDIAHLSLFLDYLNRFLKMNKVKYEDFMKKYQKIISTFLNSSEPSIDNELREKLLFYVFRELGNKDYTLDATFLKNITTGEEHQANLLYSTFYILFNPTYSEDKFQFLWRRLHPELGGTPLSSDSLNNTNMLGIINNDDQYTINRDQLVAWRIKSWSDSFIKRQVYGDMGFSEHTYEEIEQGFSLIVNLLKENSFL
jgi:hypothetical protein